MPANADGIIPQQMEDNIATELHPVDGEDESPATISVDASTGLIQTAQWRR